MISSQWSRDGYLWVLHSFEGNFISEFPFKSFFLEGNSWRPWREFEEIKKKAKRLNEQLIRRKKWWWGFIICLAIKKIQAFIARKFFLPILAYPFFLKSLPRISEKETNFLKVTETIFKQDMDILCSPARLSIKGGGNPLKAKIYVLWWLKGHPQNPKSQTKMSNLF